MVRSCVQIAASRACDSYGMKGSAVATTTVVVRDGVFASASRGMTVIFKGRTAHAAQPETGRSPALAGWLRRNLEREIANLCRKVARKIAEGEDQHPRISRRNLHRFLGLVEEFRSEAQLLIVSHQKRTMEAADCLYGITMQPGGSSKAISEKPGADIDLTAPEHQIQPQTVS